MSDNQSRSELAYRTLLVYSQYHPTYGEVAASDYESVVGDLLTDLRHLCDEYGIDFADRVAFSEECYAEEVDHV